MITLGTLAAAEFERAAPLIGLPPVVTRVLCNPLARCAPDNERDRMRMLIRLTFLLDAYLRSNNLEGLAANASWLDAGPQTAEQSSLEAESMAFNDAEVARGHAPPVTMLVSGDRAVLSNGLCPGCRSPLGAAPIGWEDPLSSRVVVLCSPCVSSKMSKMSRP